MTDNETATYYYRRAEEEEEAARSTTNALASDIHMSMAERYRVKAWEREQGERIRLVRD